MSIDTRPDAGILDRIRDAAPHFQSGFSDSNPDFTTNGMITALLNVIDVNAWQEDGLADWERELLTYARADLSDMLACLAAESRNPGSTVWPVLSPENQSRVLVTAALS